MALNSECSLPGLGLPHIDSQPATTFIEFVDVDRMLLWLQFCLHSISPLRLASERLARRAVKPARFVPKSQALGTQNTSQYVLLNITADVPHVYSRRMLLVRVMLPLGA